MGHTKPLCIIIYDTKGIQWVSLLTLPFAEEICKRINQILLVFMNMELFELMAATVDSHTMVTDIKHNFAWSIANLFIVFHDYQLISN